MTRQRSGRAGRRRDVSRAESPSRPIVPLFGETNAIDGGGIGFLYIIMIIIIIASAQALNGKRTFRTFSRVKPFSSDLRVSALCAFVSVLISASRDVYHFAIYHDVSVICNFVVVEGIGESAVDLGVLFSRARVEEF